MASTNRRIDEHTTIKDEHVSVCEGGGVTYFITPYENDGRQRRT